jgi:hypothetical protein
MATQKAKHGGSRKIGRNTAKCASYRARKVGERHKLKRILQSNGYGAAMAYANKHGLENPVRKK